MNKHAAPAKRPATYQDVLDAPPGMVAELVRGGLHLHPRPGFRQARASFRIASRLGDPYDNGVGSPGGWVFAIEPELHLGADVLVPDLAGWRRERVSPDAPAAEAAPDWVCELLSPDGVWVLLGTVAGDGEVRLPPFEAIGFPLAALWS